VCVCKCDVAVCCGVRCGVLQCVAVCEHLCVCKYDVQMCEPAQWVQWTGLSFKCVFFCCFSVCVRMCDIFIELI